MENTPVRHVLVARFSPAMTASQFDQFINAFRDLTRKSKGSFPLSTARTSALKD